MFVSAALAGPTAGASLEGTVATSNGVGIAAAAVTISGESLLLPFLVRTTDRDGRYRFMELPGGTYTVTFQSTGFRTLTYERVLLPADAVAVLDVSLVAGEVREEARIAAAVSPRDRRTRVASILGREFLQSLPGVEDAWLILHVSPGLLVSAKPLLAPDACEANAYACQPGPNVEPRRPTLDGVEVQVVRDWPAFLNDRALQSVSVAAVGNGAESATPGPTFAALIKPGGHARHATLFLAGQLPQFRWDNVSSQLRAQGVREGARAVRDYDAGGDAGGRIAANHLWFYAALRRQEMQRRIVRYNGPAASTSASLTVKVTAQPHSRNQIIAFVQGQTKDQPQHDASAYRPAPSTTHQAAHPVAGKVDWAWTVSSRTLVSAFVARSDSRTTADPNTRDASRYDLARLVYDGAFKTSSEAAPWFDRHNRSQYGVAWSHDGLGVPVGTHEFRAALEVTTEERTRGTGALGAGQDYMLRFSNGVADDILLYNVPLASAAIATTQSACVRDTWRVGRRATIDLGVRFDRWRLSLPAQAKPAGTFADISVSGFAPRAYPPVALRAWASLVPRFGLAYALTSDAKAIVKGGWARFGDPLDLETGERYNPNALVVAEYGWSDPNGNGGYDPGERGAFIRTIGGRAARRTSANLRQPTIDEIIFAFERALARTLSASVGYVHTRAHDLIQNVNVARPFSAYTVPVSKIDPGPDGTVGTADDGRLLVVYDYDGSYAGAAFEDTVALNTPGNRAVSHTIEATVNRRTAGGWHLLASCLAARHGEWRNGVPQDPNTAAFFPWSAYWEWECKMSGGYQLPLGMRAAAVFTQRSGDPEARDVRFTGLKQAGSLVLPVQPLGGIRLPNRNLLNVRIEKRQRLGGHGQISLQADLLNATNASTPTAVVTRSGSAYGRIVAIVPPRSLRLGVEYSF